MEQEIGSDEARRDFRDLLNAVEHDGAHITVTRWHNAAAVIVPVEWYERAKAKISEGCHGDG